MAKSNKKFSRDGQYTSVRYKNGNRVSRTTKTVSGRHTVIDEDNRKVYTSPTATFNNKELKRAQRRLGRQNRRQAFSNFFTKANNALDVGGNIFTFILGFLIIVALARTLTGVQGMPTFGSFISMLQNMPNIELSITTFDFLQIKGNWIWFGADFNILKDIINSLSSVLSFGIWMVAGLVQVVIFALWVVGWMFGI